jgi:monoamine oxidase
MCLNKVQQERIAKQLKSSLDHSESLWTNKTESDAYIIGWLQGAIKSALRELE